MVRHLFERDKRCSHILLDGLKHLGEDHLVFVLGKEGTDLAILEEPIPMGESNAVFEAWIDPENSEQIKITAQHRAKQEEI